MKNELATTNDLSMMAKLFYDSGMFQDIKSASQAAVKIQCGREMGISPFASMSGIHIIAGKPTIGAGLMAARVKSFGKYDYKVVEHSDKICSIDFFQGKEKLGNSTFTIEDARRAQTKNLDKFPKNMLFARAMSNGVKWYTPDIYEAPVYVPEEMGTITEEVEVEIILDADKAIETINSASNREELTNIWKQLSAEYRALDSVIEASKEKAASFAQPTINDL